MTSNKYDLSLVERFEILDCGNPAGARYQIDAIVSSEDGQHVASEHIASCFDERRAKLVLAALEYARCANRSFRGVK